MIFMNAMWWPYKGSYMSCHIIRNFYEMGAKVAVGLQFGKIFIKLKQKVIYISRIFSITKKLLFKCPDLFYMM